VVRVHADACEVLWRNGAVKRELVPETELAWCGLQIHTRDQRSGRIVELGRETVRVRLEGGVCCWMSPGELAPRAPAEVFAE
jgi:hypothetical protein